MNANTEAVRPFAVRLRLLATALILASLSLITLFAALQAGPPASGPFPITTVILQEDDTPSGGGGLPVTTLNSPVTNGSGQVAFSGSLANGGDNTEFLWYDTALIWLSSAVVSDVSSIEEVIGLSDNGNYALSLILEPGAVDSLWTDEGLFLTQAEPAPANPGYFITSLNRPTMQSNGSLNWFSEVSDAPGGAAQFEVLYHASDLSTPIIAPLLQGGDVISGFTISAMGLDPDYFISDNGSHFITFVQTTAPFTQDGFLYLDGTLPLREGAATGAGDNWHNFDLFQVNNDGHYLVSGDTDGPATSDEFIAYDGLIQVREGDTVGGVTLTSSAVVRQLSLNNLGQTAMLWRILSGQEILFFACDAAALANATAVLSSGDLVDTNGDGQADATLTDFNTSTAPTTFSLAEDGRMYVEAALDYGAGPVAAIIALALPSCTGNTAPVAADDAYTATQAIPLVITAPGVLANDIDGEGDDLIALLIQDPSHGSLTLNNDGSFDYMPDTTFSGNDSFTYRAHDGAALSNLAAVAITVTGSSITPGLQVNPLSLQSSQPIDTLVTQTLMLTNTGTTSLTWAIGRGPTITYTNGPLVNLPGGGPNGADASLLQNNSLGMVILGYNDSLSNDNRLADEFTITDSDGWLIDTLTFYAYQTGSALTSTMTALNLRIWDGPPDVPTSTVIFGDTGTNRLLQTGWTGIYRISESLPDSDIRPIMANTATVNTFLPAGTYWLDWQTDGTLLSGPWAPPLTISNVVTTGNSLQLVNGVWEPVTDTDSNNNGTHAPQGFPFHIAGSLSDCQQPDWITVSPDNDTLAPDTAASVAVVFDSTDLPPDTYNGELCLTSSDSNNPFLRLPLTLTSLAPALTLTTTLGLDPNVCGSDTALLVADPVDVYYCYTVTNNGNITLTLHDLADSQFGSIFSAIPAELVPGATLDNITAGFPISAPITTTTVTTATWTAYNPGPIDEVTATDTAAVIISTPAIAFTVTVGTNPFGCAPSSHIIAAVGTEVYYCYHVTNTGDVTLMLHDLTDSFGPLFTDYPFTLPPGSHFNTVAAGITRTLSILTHTVNTAVWTASNGSLINVTATHSATVTAVVLYPVHLPFIIRP